MGGGDGGKFLSSTRLCRRTIHGQKKTSEGYAGTKKTFVVEDSLPRTRSICPKQTPFMRRRKSKKQNHPTYQLQ